MSDRKDYAMYGNGSGRNWTTGKPMQRKPMHPAPSAPSTPFTRQPRQPRPLSAIGDPGHAWRNDVEAVPLPLAPLRATSTSSRGDQPDVPATTVEKAAATPMKIEALLHKFPSLLTEAERQLPREQYTTILRGRVKAMLGEQRQLREAEVTDHAMLTPLASKHQTQVAARYLDDNHAQPGGRVAGVSSLHEPNRSAPFANNAAFLPTQSSALPGRNTTTMPPSAAERQNPVARDQGYRPPYDGEDNLRTSGTIRRPKQHGPRTARTLEAMQAAVAQAPRPKGVEPAQHGSSSTFTMSGSAFLRSQPVRSPARVFGIEHQAVMEDERRGPPRHPDPVEPDISQRSVVRPPVTQPATAPAAPEETAIEPHRCTTVEDARDVQRALSPSLVSALFDINDDDIGMDSEPARSSKQPSSLPILSEGAIGQPAHPSEHPPAKPFLPLPEGDSVGLDSEPTRPSKRPRTKSSFPRPPEHSVGDSLPAESVVPSVPTPSAFTAKRRKTAVSKPPRQPLAEIASPVAPISTINRNIPTPTAKPKILTAKAPPSVPPPASSAPAEHLSNLPADVFLELVLKALSGDVNKDKAVTSLSFNIAQDLVRKRADLEPSKMVTLVPDESPLVLDDAGLQVLLAALGDADLLYPRGNRLFPIEVHRRIAAHAVYHRLQNVKIIKFREFPSAETLALVDTAVATLVSARDRSFIDPKMLLKDASVKEEAGKGGEEDTLEEKDASEQQTAQEQENPPEKYAPQQKKAAAPILCPSASLVVMGQGGLSNLYNAHIRFEQLKSLVSPSSLCIDFSIEQFRGEDDTDSAHQPAIVDAIANVVFNSWSKVSHINFHEVSAALPSLNHPAVHRVFYSDSGMDMGDDDAILREPLTTALCAKGMGRSKRDGFLDRWWAPILVNEAQRILRFRRDIKPPGHKPAVKSVKSAKWELFLPALPDDAGVDPTNHMGQFEGALYRQVMLRIQNLQAIVEAEEAEGAGDPDDEAFWMVFPPTAAPKPPRQRSKSVHPSKSALSLNSTSARSASSGRALSATNLPKPPLRLEVLPRQKTKPGTKQLEWVVFNNCRDKTMVKCPCCHKEIQLGKVQVEDAKRV